MNKKKPTKSALVTVFITLFIAIISAFASKADGDITKYMNQHTSTTQQSKAQLNNKSLTAPKH